MEAPRIKIKAMCLFVHEGRVLVADGETLEGKKRGRAVVPSKFYRILGGTIDFGETAEDGVRREIREELQSEIENLRHLDVLENLFTYAGEKGHEIVFLFSGVLAKKELCEKEVIHIDESDYEFDAKWVLFADLLNGDKPLYPNFDYRTLFQGLKS